MLVQALALLVLATSPEQDRIRADVERLASDAWQGRKAGTAGADAAADWIADEFRKAGLEPVGGSYFQGFSFIDGVSLGRDNRLAVGGHSFRPGEDFRPLAFSAAGAVSGSVVFAGYGIVAKDLDYDDYAGFDAKGKTVLVLRYASGGDDPHSKWSAFASLRQKATTARDRGAVALLVVTGPGTRDAKDELVPLRGDASLTDAGLPVVSIKRAVAEALLAGSATTLAEAQKETAARGRPFPLLASVELNVDVTPTRATTRNVLGLARGVEPADGVVVVGAHYDHLGLGMSGSLEAKPDGKIHHGADDNASGVAALLALARRQGLLAERPWRDVLYVAFGAEEEGTLGSSHFVKDPPIPLDRVVAMINMDMIGRLRDASLSVHGVGTSPTWKPFLEQANESAGLKLKLHDGGYGPSDHSPFYAAGKPVLFVFTGAHADYHRASDTADKVNVAGVAKVVGLVGGVLSRLASSGEPVAFTAVAADKDQAAAGGRGFKVWVGGIPDYSAEAVGVTISGISPGSPAEKAGMKAGDVIVGFGGKEIRNVYDYTFALSDKQPGDRVAIIVKRGELPVTLEAVLGTRASAAR